MADGIKRIKTAFKGDEQYMMLSTYYKQHNYHPMYALRSSVSLIIQVPFFIAAYHFLSNLWELQGESFSFISNLGAPDQLLSIGGITINVLPIIMTIINIVAGIIYMKGFPVKDKVQLYSMAGLFLILLYNSPSGLVLYWTLNNVFSLIKNIFYRFKNPLRIVYVLTVIITIAFTIIIFTFVDRLTIESKMIIIAAAIFMILLPLVLRVGNKIYSTYLSSFSNDDTQRNLIFILSSVLLFLLYGLVVPSNLISSSPVEFSFTGELRNPLSFIFHTATIFLGLWVVWGVFIYALSNKKVKTIIAFSFVILSFSTLINLFIFKGNYGNINRTLQFDNPVLLKPSLLELLGPLVLIMICIILFLVLSKYQKNKIIVSILTIFTLGSSVSAIMTSYSIQSEYKVYEARIASTVQEDNLDEELVPEFHVSRDGKNVIFIFLDRAISGYLPVIMDQFPELKDQYEGFTYYPNTVSFGNSTILGVPAMLAGYEYTPDEINKRSSEKLVDKHNEALLVLPKLFLDADYSVTITDPPYSNYQENGDFTPYIPYPDMKVMKHLQKFATRYKRDFSDVIAWDLDAERNIIKSRLPIFSILKTTLPVARFILYDKGFYFTSLRERTSVDAFVDTYAQLHYLPKLTDFSAQGNTFTFIGNDTTHEPLFLQTPQYEPQSVVSERSSPLDTVDGITPIDITHYHANVAAIKKLGSWFDTLKKEGAYDNSKIIIVADHATTIYSPHFESFANNGKLFARFNPLFLVKEFNASGPIETNEEFMTHADAPLFAIKDTGVSPINPFTGKNMVDSMKKERVVIHLGSGNVKKQNGNVFIHSELHNFEVRGSIMIESNWSILKNE